MKITSHDLRKCASSLRISRVLHFPVLVYKELATRHLQGNIVETAEHGVAFMSGREKLRKELLLPRSLRGIENVSSQIYDAGGTPSPRTGPKNNDSEWDEPFGGTSSPRQIIDGLFPKVSMSRFANYVPPWSIIVKISKT